MGPLNACASLQSGLFTVVVAVVVVVVVIAAAAAAGVIVASEEKHSLLLGDSLSLVLSGRQQRCQSPPQICKHINPKP